MKRIFLTARVDTLKATGEVRDGVDENLAAFLAGLGLEVLILPNHPGNFKRALADLEPDGIVLSGGNDVDPRRYGRLRGKAQGLSPARDAVELAAVKHCRLRGIPLIGICRGLQLINVAFGGTLTRDLAEAGNNHAAVGHGVELLESFPLPGYRGKKVRVNSYHNHGVTPADLARPLLPMALSPDGLVEGLRHRSLPIFAIQWHPERRGSPSILDRALFRAAFFGKRAKARA